MAKHTLKYFKYVWSFYNIMHERVKLLQTPVTRLVVLVQLNMNYELKRFWKTIEARLPQS